MQAPKKIAVAGATGRLGRHVVDVLESRGHDVVAMSTRSLPGGRADNIVEITESTPNLTVTFESREGPTPFRYRYAVEPTGHGSRLILDADISSAGLPGPLAHLDGVATRAFKQGMRHNLQRLKDLVESTAP